MLSTFFIRVFSILVIVTSNSLSGNVYHYVIYSVLIVVSFLQILCVLFSLPFGIPYNLLLEVGYLVSGNGTEVNRPVV